MRILHIADVHLDRPFVGLPPTYARARRADVRDAFRRSLRLAHERDVDLVTIGGDLWEDENVVSDTRLSVARELQQVAVPVAIVAGNHDPLIAGGHYEQTSWPSNVQLFHGPPAQEFRLRDLSVWGVSWTADGLSASFLDSFTTPADGRAHVLLIHGTASTNSYFAETGVHCPFEPAHTARAGFAAVLCGHIHAASWQEGVVYPGSPEPLGWGETGRHCAAVIDISPGGAPQVELIDVNRRRYEHRAVDCTGASSSTEVSERLEEALADLAVEASRVCLKADLTGRVGADVDLNPGVYQRELQNRFDHVRVVNATTRAWNLDALAQASTADGRFVAALRKRLSGTEDARERQVVELALEAGLRAMKGDGMVLDVD